LTKNLHKITMYRTYTQHDICSNNYDLRLAHLFIYMENNCGCTGKLVTGHDLKMEHSHTGK